MYMRTDYIPEGGFYFLSSGIVRYLIEHYIELEPWCVEDLAVGVWITDGYERGDLPDLHFED